MSDEVTGQIIELFDQFLLDVGIVTHRHSLLNYISRDEMWALNDKKVETATKLNELKRKYRNRELRNEELK